jgi:hypothetical protein
MSNRDNQSPRKARITRNAFRRESCAIVDRCLEKAITKGDLISRESSEDQELLLNSDWKEELENAVDAVLGHPSTPRVGGVADRTTVVSSSTTEQAPRKSKRRTDESSETRQARPSGEPGSDGTVKKAGRPRDPQTKAIFDAWEKMGKSKVTAADCDKLGKQFFPDELKGGEPGKKKHKAVRERIRAAILRQQHYNLLQG